MTSLSYGLMFQCGQQGFFGIKIGFRFGCGGGMAILEALLLATVIQFCCFKANFMQFYTFSYHMLSGGPTTRGPTTQNKSIWLGTTWSLGGPGTCALCARSVIRLSLKGTCQGKSFFPGIILILWSSRVFLSSALLSASVCLGLLWQYSEHANK